MLQVPTTVKRCTRRNLHVFECCAPSGQQAVPKRTRLDLRCVIRNCLVEKDFARGYCKGNEIKCLCPQHGLPKKWKKYIESCHLVSWFLVGIILVSCFGYVSTSDWSGLQAPWLEPGIFSSCSAHLFIDFQHKQQEILRWKVAHHYPKNPQLVSGLMKNARKKRTSDAWGRKVLDGMNLSNKNEVNNLTPKRIIHHLRHLSLNSYCPLVVKEVTRNVRPKWTAI